MPTLDEMVMDLIAQAPGDWRYGLHSETKRRLSVALLAVLRTHVEPMLVEAVGYGLVNDLHTDEKGSVLNEKNNSLCHDYAARIITALTESKNDDR